MKAEDDGIWGCTLGWAEHGKAMKLVQLFAFGVKPSILTEPGGELSQFPPSVCANAALLRGDAFGRESKQVKRGADRGGIARDG